MSLKDVLIPTTPNPLHGLCRTGKLKFALTRDIATFPDLPARAAAFAGSATDADYVTIDDDFVFNTPLSQGFAQIDIRIHSGDQMGDTVGELGSLQGMPKLMFDVIGNSDAAEAFMARVMNEDIAAIVPEADGTNRLYGSPCYPARIESINAKNPKIPTESFKGASYVLYFYDIKPRAPKFTGAAPLIPE